LTVQVPVPLVIVKRPLMFEHDPALVGHCKSGAAVAATVKDELNAAQTDMRRHRDRLVLNACR
jgi:hypothetical protein